MSSYWKLHKIPILIALGSIIFYWGFAYHLVREDFLKLICLFAALFFFCFKLIQFEKYNFKFLLVVGILFRLVFLVAEPNLSQDFYRFIWDGELINNGINPYVYTPNEVMQNSAFYVRNSKFLYEGMGELSARHFSNYPPVNQLFFTMAAFLGGGGILGNIIVTRLTIILADLGILYIGRKLLRNLNKPTYLIFWYFLNPLVVIELTGNLHFEGVMLYFFLWALYLISKKKWLSGAIVYSASIMVKLVPILFLPLFIAHFKFKKSILFYSVIGLSCILMLLPFYNASFLNNYGETVGLWFSNFEFNAGIYNLVKKIGILQFDAKPWVLVKDYGSVVPLLVILLTLVVTIYRKNQKMEVLLKSMLILLTVYYFLSSTVHPWYIVFLAILSIFTEYRFAIVWSAMVVLSYFAYSQPDFKENLWLILIEYSFVFGVLFYEIFKIESSKSLFRQKSSSE